MYCCIKLDKLLMTEKTKSKGSENFRAPPPNNTGCCHCFGSPPELDGKTLLLNVQHHLLWLQKAGTEPEASALQVSS